MWLPKEGKFILLFSNKISESGISAWATTRGRPYEIIFMRLNDNLTVCFLLDHPGKPIPEPYPGSGVALRQNNNLPTYKRTRQAAPRRLGAAKPHIFRAVSTENTKPQVLSAAVRPPDETFPEAARLTAAYNLQTTRYRQASSADYRFPSPQCKSATASNI